MNEKPRNLGRAYLVKELQKRGVSRRLAVRILDLVFGEMSQAHKRGEVVEFPLGKLKRVPRGKYWDEIDDWPANRRRYKVKWELDEAENRLTEESDQDEQAPALPREKDRSVHQDRCNLAAGKLVNNSHRFPATWRRSRRLIPQSGGRRRRTRVP